MYTDVPAGPMLIYHFLSLLLVIHAFTLWVQFRWIWKEGITTSGGLVPWNIEALNTAKGVLGWEPNAPNIIAKVC